MFKIGNCVKFGNYFTTSNSCKEAIEWIILDQNEDSLLVISKYVIDAHIFNGVWGTGVTWETSEIRKWLNEDLFDSLFNNEEKEFIVSSKILTNDNPKPIELKFPSGAFSLIGTTESGIRGCGETIDKLFLLSWEEGKKYFADDMGNSQRNIIYNNLCRNFKCPEINDMIIAKKNLKTIATNYAKSKMDYENDENSANFWFRSPGSTGHAFVFSSNGLINRMGIEQGDIVGVRPAMWLLKKGVTEQYALDTSETSQSIYDINNQKTNWFMQAVLQAKKYVSELSFSYKGLVEQLEFDGFTHEQAIYAADNCNSDWFNQALLQARGYLSERSFSYKGLVEQLEFDGFTHEEAIYAADNV